VTESGAQFIDMPVLSETGEKALTVPGFDPDPEIQGGFAHHILPRIPHDPREIFVDVEIDSICDAVEIDGHGQGVKGGAEFLLAFTQRCLRPSLLRDFRRDAPDGRDPPLGIEERELGRRVLVSAVGQHHELVKGVRARRNCRTDR
jgi:hypothetical protein